MPRGVVDHRLEVGLRLGGRPTLGGDVAVVEAVERDTELGDELERGVELGSSGGQGIQPRLQPGAVERAGAEHVRAGRVERVPQADGDPEVVFHALAEHEPIGLVDLVRQRLARLEAAEGDAPRHLREEVLSHGLSSMGPALVFAPVYRGAAGGEELDLQFGP